MWEVVKSTQDHHHWIPLVLRIPKMSLLVSLALLLTELWMDEPSGRIHCIYYNGCDRTFRNLNFKSQMATIPGETKTVLGKLTP